MKKNERIRNDILLILAFLVFAAIVGLFVFFLGKPGAMVSVAVDGEEVMLLPLNEDATVDILSGEGDENINTVVVENGKVYVSYADCPDNICVDRGEISREGETIVCLPHKFVVKVIGGEEAETDVVSN